MTVMREKRLQYARRELGQSYEKIKKLSIRQPKIFDSKRNKLVDYLLKNGARTIDGNLSKLYLNKLSPGCRSCAGGTWSCVALSMLCSRKCFYCPQDRKKLIREEPPSEAAFVFPSVERYVDYLKKFDFDGIGFTGGDPFMAFGTLAKYIKKVRKVFGKKHYIWVYTNGDLVTEAKLKILKRVGLNEIRFDLSATGYDVEPVRKAAKYIDTVTVEIPAIPEDMKLVKSLIKKMEKIGVKYLNLHELMFTVHNQKALIERKYTILHNTLQDRLFPVMESEITALELLKYAVNAKVKMGINYCTKYYKNRFQLSARRRRFAKYFKRENDHITETGLIRRLSAGRKKDAIHPEELLKYMGKDASITVRYYNPIPDHKMVTRSRVWDNKILSRLLQKGSGRVGKRPIYETRLEGDSEIYCFYKLFVERMDAAALSLDIVRRFRPNKKDSSNLLKNIRVYYAAYSDKEYIAKDIPDYF